MPPQLRFRIRAAATFAQHTWDGVEFLIHDGTTGDTHLVNRVTLEALKSFEASPRTTDELCRAVADALGVEVDEQFEANMAALVSHLDRLGFVEPDS